MRLRPFLKSKISAKKWENLVLSRAYREINALKKSVNKLIKKVPKDYHVYVIKNGNNTLGALFFDMKSAIECILSSLKCLVVPRGHGMQEEAFALDARKTDEIYKSLQMVWERDPEEWDYTKKHLELKYKQPIKKKQRKD
jgi:hypothetical protein